MHRILAAATQNDGTGGGGGVNSGLFGQPVQPPTNAYSATSIYNPYQATSNFESFLSALIGFVTVVAGLAFLLYFITGGLAWVTASGDSGKIQKARDQMMQGVMGMIIIAASYGVMGVLGKFLGLDLLHPGQAILHLMPKQ